MVALILCACVRPALDADDRPVRRCPVHDVRLKNYRVETLYGLPLPQPEEFLQESRRSFPYAAHMAPQGCVMGLFSWANRHDRVKACPACTGARDAFCAEQGMEGWWCTY